MFSDDNVDEVFNDRDGKYNYKEEYSVTNSQIYGKLVQILGDDEDNLRGGTHILGAREDAAFISKQTLFEQKSFSVGISAGQLSMAAALLGYKTGYCSVFERNVKRTTK